MGQIGDQYSTVLSVAQNQLSDRSCCKKLRTAAALTDNRPLLGDQYPTAMHRSSLSQMSRQLTQSAELSSLIHPLHISVNVGNEIYMYTCEYIPSSGQ